MDSVGVPSLLSSYYHPPVIVVPSPLQSQQTNTLTNSDLVYFSRRLVLWTLHGLFLVAIMENPGYISSGTRVPSDKHDTIRGHEWQYMTNLIQEALISDVARNRILKLRNETAGEYMECMLKILDSPASHGIHLPREWRYKLGRLLVCLSAASSSVPPSLFINDITSSSRNAVAGGSYADIFLANHEGRKVALKRLRVFQTSQGSVTTQFYREAIIWQRLKHLYILPFLGVGTTFYPYPCMVSPWMHYGNINNCMKQLEKNGQTIPLKSWVSQIALGLLYLHNEHIVHGDLRGANVLVTDDLIIQLSDFGLARFADPSSMTTGSHPGGAARWTAPEVVHSAQPVSE
ncbi:unnamed protein product [Somion occarium]|uniref:Protein kinase domain-containing protein n=1 Tax=Somion occarium TaxID=3059160 RepID=A0ABP1D6N2_9APHY